MPIDYKKYHPQWKGQIVPDILKRAGNCCEVCGVSNKALIIRGTWNGVEAYQDFINGTIFDANSGELIGCDYVGEIHPTNKPIGIVLTIAHLDHDINNNDYSNLKAMCQLHHLRYDKEHHANTKKANKLKKQPQLF